VDGDDGLTKRGRDANARRQVAELAGSPVVRMHELKHKIQGVGSTNKASYDVGAGQGQRRGRFKPCQRFRTYQATRQTGIIAR
jgi:hypothetical protein